MMVVVTSRDIRHVSLISFSIIIIIIVALVIGSWNMEASL
jgi:hypothetical protein